MAVDRVPQTCVCGPALLVSLATAIAGAACAGGADTCVGVGREWARLNAWAAASRRSDPLISCYLSFQSLHPATL